ncbi:Gfo/Idh/MocA family oxidoreductase [Candidatus Pelagibacter sp.]|nr:Gfo/Idh/MocA family oxidoreductase [Candidatus Pelagibacter sp.]
MHSIVLIGFGSIGYRYFQAIDKIHLNKKIFIVDKNKLAFKKINNSNKNKIKTLLTLKEVPKKVDLVIVSTTCNNRIKLFTELNKYTAFKNLIVEKPLTQSPLELKKLDLILRNKKNCWVNTDRRSLKIYKEIKKKLNLEKKIQMTVSGENWGICCNGLHFLDLFNYMSNNQITSIKETKKTKWIKSKRDGFYDLDNGKIKIDYGQHELLLMSKMNKSKIKKNFLNVNIKNNKNFFRIIEKPDGFDLFYQSKKKYFKNELTSIKMKKIIKKILLKERSNLPKFSNSSIIYMPMVKFFLEKWKTYKKNSTKAPIT